MVEIGCPTTRKRWTLTCVDGQWDDQVDDKCPGVPGVSLPGDIVDAQPSHNDDSDDFLSSFPISK